MGEVIDFTKYKSEKEDPLEQDYIKFLSHVNKLVGQPKTVEKCIQIIYFTLRYFQGTINCLNTLPILGVYCPREYIEQIKQTVLPWLNEISTTIKNL